ncbi:MAG: translation initiation factor IF-1 [Myxococcales bacterium]|nr:translation initiation factor IF-1 [Myxococcales bacterium]
MSATPERGGPELEGKVERTLPKGLYEIRLDDGRSIRATPSAHAKKVLVKLLPGDRVLVSLSPYDPGRGRILSKV